MCLNKPLGYCSFGGAVGDGVHDDFDAIKRTHDKANEIGAPVVAEAGKRFNVGAHKESITIMTDTDWTGAEIIIDDHDIPPESDVRVTNVFVVASSVSPRAVEGIGGLSRGQKNIGVRLGTPALLHIKDENRRQYIRYGLNNDSGQPYQEIILVDEDGNVDESTPIMWDYSSITSATAYYTADETITLKGGTFISVANRAPRRYTYYHRGILIKRSNTVICDTVWRIEGEGDSGAPYAGNHTFSYCNNVLVENVTYTPHKTYRLETNSDNQMGTYAFQAGHSNNILWKNSRQSIDITDKRYWGIMGSNYCKNLAYDGCYFSRFDAHQGTYNTSIKNSEIGHHFNSVVGAGTFTIESSTVYGNNIVNLRSDYGSTWNGDVVIKNVRLVNTVEAPTLIGLHYTPGHSFGYTCYLPHTVTLDNVTLGLGTHFNVFPELDEAVGVDPVNPYVPTERLIVMNNKEGYTYSVSKNDGTLLKNTEIIEE